VTRITIACLDMAGTTVADDGGVMAAFTAAVADCGLAPGSAEHARALQIARGTMGQSKIEVVRLIMPDEACGSAAAPSASSRWQETPPATWSRACGPAQGWWPAC